MDIHGWSLDEVSRQNSYGNVRPTIINLHLWMSKGESATESNPPHKLFNTLMFCFMSWGEGPELKHQQDGPNLSLSTFLISPRNKGFHPHVVFTEWNISQLWLKVLEENSQAIDNKRHHHLLYLHQVRTRVRWTKDSEQWMRESWKSYKIKCGTTNFSDETVHRSNRLIINTSWRRWMSWCFDN